MVILNKISNKKDNIDNIEAIMITAEVYFEKKVTNQKQNNDDN